MFTDPSARCGTFTARGDAEHQFAIRYDRSGGEGALWDNVNDVDQTDLVFLVCFSENSGVNVREIGCGADEKVAICIACLRLSFVPANGADVCEERYQFCCIRTDDGDIAATDEHSDDFPLCDGAAPDNETFLVLEVYVCGIKHFADTGSVRLVSYSGISICDEFACL